MRCPSCGRDNREDARFCKGCGASLAPACPSCGAKLEPDASFCDSCGASLTEAAPPELAPSPAPAIPASFAFGRYQVRRFVGEGGRKRVYLAHDTKLDRDVAFAVIKTEGLDASGLARIRREAQAMGRLGDHPNIVTVFDIGEEAGQPYIVSQYMGGGDLEGLLQQTEDHHLPIDRAVVIANEIRQALEYAHGRRIVHRDVKPGNIWLSEDGVAKLGDFGLAMALERSRLTMEGMMVGTVAYMPPEQALGREADARSDLYSWGCVLYEMVTGRPPFLGDDAVAIISQHINTAPVVPSWHNPEVPRALESLILRCLAKDPKERPESAAALFQAMQAIMATASTVAEKVVQEEANPLDRLAGGVFVGREKEMDELRAGLEDALSGRGRLLMLVGEPGIGKTRTAEELATYASLRSTQVLWGRCYEGEGAPAYWPWVQVIRSYVHDRDPQALMSEMGPGAADIAQVVSEVRERLPGLPTPPALEPEQARFRLFDSITTFLKNAGSRQPLVLVLDDLHWADKPSLLLLQFLARELRGTRLMVLGNYRDVELRREHPLADTLAELTRQQLSQRILLRGLTERDVARFIELTAGISPPEALVRAVYRETEGNPFFVNEIVRLLVADRRLERPEEVKSWSVTIPQGVREVVGRRLNHLSKECNRVLAVASVIGREFGLDALQRVSEVKGDRLLEALEEAVAARVLNEVPRAVDRYSFSHALIQDTLYEELSATRRVRLHQHIGDELEALYGGRAEEHAAELAYHYGQAAAVGGTEKLIRYAGAAGRRAARQHGHEEAVRHFQAALSAKEGEELDDESAALLFDLARSLMATVEVQEAWRSLRQAFTYYVNAGDVSHAVDVAEVAGSTTMFLRPTQTQLIERALGLVDAESPEARRLQACLGYSVGMMGDYDRAQQAFRLAGAIAEREADPRAELRVVAFEAGVNLFHWRLSQALEMVLRTIELAQQLGEPPTEAQAHFTAGHIKAILGDPGAEQHADAERELAEQQRYGPAIVMATYFQAACRSARGDWDGTRACLERGLGIDPQDPRHLLVAALLDLELGNFEEAWGFLDRLQEMMSGGPSGDHLLSIPYTAAMLPFAAIVTGEPKSLDVAEEAARLVLAAPLWTTPLIAVQARIGLGMLAVVRNDPEAAAEQYNVLELFRGTSPGFGLQIDHLCALLATVLNRTGDAVEHFEGALRFLRRGYRPGYAWAAYDYARVLVQRNAEGDRQRAVKLLDESLEISDELGMRPLMERALALKMEVQGILTSGEVRTSVEAVAESVQAEQPDLRPHAAPDGTVTLLFTDIEGSTAMTERLGDQRWLELLHAHNDIVREQVEAHGGFKVKSQGDGFMLAFGSARRAIQCAIDVQRAIAQHNEEYPEEPIRVRIGLHTGEAIREAEDFYGRHVILASRIADQAQGGEILVSSLLKELTESAGDIQFGEGREVELKGLKGKQRIFGVAWEPT